MERVPFSVGKNVLLPASAEASAVMDKLKVGETVAVEVYRERPNKLASKIHFVFERIAISQGVTVRNVRGWVAAATGRADLVQMNGIAVPVPWGTGPRDMSADDLEAFWSDARQIITDEILPTLTAEDAAEVQRLMAFNLD